MGYSTLKECTPEQIAKINAVSYYDPSTYVDSDEEEDDKDMKGECETQASKIESTKKAM